MGGKLTRLMPSRSTITFNRSELYEKVWQTPITKLAATYGLSDNGLRKVCVSLDVPVPPRGYWAKLAAGHKLKRAPLPEPSRQAQFASRPPPPPPERPFQLGEDAVWLEQRMSSELQHPAIEVDPAPTRWHPALRELKARLDEAAKAAEMARRDDEREEARRAKNPKLRAAPNFSGLNWSTRFRGGGVLLATHKAAAIRVSAGTYKQALALLNALFRAADERGVVPSIDDKQGRFTLELESSRLEFAVRERFEEEWRDETRWDGKVDKVKHYVPSGQLVLSVYKNGWDARQYKPNADGAWGDLSAAVFQPLYRRVVLDREHRREAQDRERRQELYRQEVRRQEQLRVEREEAARREREREAKLLTDATNWHKAQVLRAFVAASMASTDPPESDWAEWARKVADRLDPTRSG